MNPSEILKRAAEKSGFARTKFVEKNTPTAMNSIVAMSYFGDLRSSVVLSSLLLHRTVEEEKGSKYFIMCSWPGYESLFPYVDEYWSIKDTSILKSFMNKCKDFDNVSEQAVLLPRGLNYFFQDTLLGNHVDKYYNRGITQDFFDRFRNVKRFLPAIPSSVILGDEFNREMTQRPGYKIFIYPTANIRTWHNGKLRMIKSSKDFWLALARKLIDARYCPVVYRDYLTYDLSPELTTECIHLRDTDVGGIMAAMRASSCVLDVFNGISRLSFPARCPFLAVDERSRYNAYKEHELDDLLGNEIPKEYIFSFPTIIGSGDERAWDVTLLDHIVSKLDSFLPKLDRDQWPPTSESYLTVPYDKVRKQKSTRLGTRFVKVERI
ncbi:MAG: hypothetical protein ACW99G_03040 [Candidatus Thorarchaeota archaeon]|jgi:hypothetical protein